MTGRVQRLGERQKTSGMGGKWTYIKEVLGWTIDMEAGTVALPERKLWEILNLVDIPVTQCRIG